VLVKTAGGAGSQDGAPRIVGAEKSRAQAIYTPNLQCAGDSPVVDSAAA
jgi:hypothetical protein